MNFSLFSSRNSSCIKQYHIRITILILHIFALLIANMSNYLWTNNNKRRLICAWFTLSELLVRSVRCMFMSPTYTHALCTVCCINNEGYIVCVYVYFYYLAECIKAHVDENIFLGSDFCFVSRIITNVCYRLCLSTHTNALPEIVSLSIHFSHGRTFLRMFALYECE